MYSLCDAQGRRRGRRAQRSTPGPHTTEVQLRLESASLMVRDPIPALTRCPPSEPPTAGALHLSHHPSSSAGRLLGSPERRLSSHGARRPIPLAFSLALLGFPGSRCPSGPWAPRRTLLRSNPAPLLSQDEGEAGVLQSYNFSFPQPTFPGARAAGSRA